MREALPRCRRRQRLGELSRAGRPGLRPRPGPHEHERLPVIRAQVNEIRQRQQAGLLPAGLDPALLRMLGFALVSTRACCRRSPG